MIEHFTHQIITIIPTNIRNEYGESIEEKSYEVKAKVQSYISNSIDNNGNTVTSQFNIFFEAPKPVAPRCDIIITSNDPYVKEYQLTAIDVKNYFDIHNKYRFTTIIC